jgi:hypothetical protein
MKILFDNYSLTSTLTALHADANYPVSNLKHDFLKKIFKSTEASDTITIAFGSAKTVDCCYIGFTNATTITLTLYNSSDTVLYTQAISATYLGDTFTPVAGVSYATVAFSGSADIYVGNIGIGSAVTMPGHSPKLVKVQVDESSKSVSTYGQYRKNKVPWRKQTQSEHFVYSYSDWNTYYGLFEDVSTPVWVDVFEETPGAINPFYADVELGNISRDKDQYTFVVTCTEAL